MGYILGLGDRHPSNLMLDRYSGEHTENGPYVHVSWDIYRVDATLYVSA